MPSDIIDQYNPDVQQQQPPQPPLPLDDIEQRQLLPTAADDHHGEDALDAAVPRTAHVSGSRLKLNPWLPPDSHQAAVPPATSHLQPSDAVFSLETVAPSPSSASQRDVEEWCRRLAAWAAQWQQPVDHAGLAACIARNVGAFPLACRDDIAGTCTAQLDDGLRSALTSPPTVVRGHVDAMLLLVSAGVVPALVVLRAAAWLGDDPQGPGVADALVEFADALTRRSLRELLAAVPLLMHGLKATREHVSHELRILVDLSLGKLWRAFCIALNKSLARRERYVEDCRALFEQGSALDNFYDDNTPNWLLQRLFDQVACFGASTVALDDLALDSGDAAQRDLLWHAAGILEYAGIVRRTLIFGVQAVAFAVRHPCDAWIQTSTREMLSILPHVHTQYGANMYTMQQIDEVRAVAAEAGLITSTPIDANLPMPCMRSELPRVPLVFPSKLSAMRSGMRTVLAGLRVFSPQSAALTVARLGDALAHVSDEHSTSPAMDLKAIAVRDAFAAIPEMPEWEAASISGDADVTDAASAVVAFIASLTGSLTDTSVITLYRTSVPPKGASETDPAYEAARRKFVFTGLVGAGLVSRGLVTDAVIVNHLRCAVGRAHTVPAYQYYAHAFTLASNLSVLGRLKPNELDGHVAWLEHGCERHDDEGSTAYWAVRSALAAVTSARLLLQLDDPASEAPEPAPSDAFARTVPSRRRKVFPAANSRRNPASALLDGTGYGGERVQLQSDTPVPDNAAAVQPFTNALPVWDCHLVTQQQVPSAEQLPSTSTADNGTHSSS